MNKMVKSLFGMSIAALMLLTVFLTSCEKETETKTITKYVTVDTSKFVIVSGDTMKIIKGEITTTQTLSADTSYILVGFVYVTSGGKIVIPAGTIIKGDKATQGSLIVEPGGMIDAQGTKDKPIVFTSAQAVGARTYGDWGGIVLCGNAPVNTIKGTTKPQIEGGPRTTYGGDKVDDNSGILKFVRIEFGGYPFQPDKEINGLTLAGVGNGTTIDYIQVSYCGDDSYEWFGGTVNAKHLIAFRGQDDEFDTDNGWVGKVQFALGIRDFRKADISGSNGFESDNDASGSTNGPLTQGIFSNVSCFGPYDSITRANVTGDFKRAMHLRRNTALSIYNSVFAGWPIGLIIDEDKAYANATSGKLVIKNTALVNCPTPFAAASAAKTFADTTVRDWFLTTMTGNKVYKPAAKNKEYSNDNPNKLLGIFGAFAKNDEKTAPTITPSTGSELLTAAKFDDAAIKDAFFDQTVTFIGAVGAEDWTAGWAEWAPKYKEY
jgi:hypothetical protein